MKKCINYGAEIKDEAKFCDECGAEQTTENDDYNNIETAKKSDKKPLILTVCVILIIVVICAVISVVAMQKNNEKVDTRPKGISDEIYTICFDLLNDMDDFLENGTSVMWDLRPDTIDAYKSIGEAILTADMTNKDYKCYNLVCEIWNRCTNINDMPDFVEIRELRDELKKLLS